MLLVATLEYCCSTWDPHLETQKHELDKVQRRAARYVCDEYGQGSSPTAMLKTLGWESLEATRKKFKLSLTYDHVAIPVDRYLKPINRQTRGCSHSLKLLEPRTNCEYLQ